VGSRSSAKQGVISMRNVSLRPRAAASVFSVGGGRVRLLVLLFVLATCHRADPTYGGDSAKSDDQKSTEALRLDDEVTVRLTSRPFATPIYHRGKEITSLEVSLLRPEGDSRHGVLQLNQTKLRFNNFGDAEPIGKHRSDRIPVRFQKCQIEDPKRGGSRELLKSVSSEQLYCTLYLVLATSPSDADRLVVVYDAGIESNASRSFHEVSATYVIALKPVPANTQPSSVRESRKPGQIDLASDLVRTTIGLKQFRIRGEVGGKADFYLNPNDVSYTVFGDNGITTLLGWGPRKVMLERQKDEDPRGKGRDLYEIVAGSPRMTRYYLVIDDEPKGCRIVIRQGELVQFVLPMKAT